LGIKWCLPYGDPKTEVCRMLKMLHEKAMGSMRNCLQNTELNKVNCFYAEGLIASMLCVHQKEDQVCNVFQASFIKFLCGRVVGEDFLGRRVTSATFKDRRNGRIR
jgi:hypothetical protein